MMKNENVNARVRCVARDLLLLLISRRKGKDEIDKYEAIINEKQCCDKSNSLHLLIALNDSLSIAVRFCTAKRRMTALNHYHKNANKTYQIETIFLRLRFCHHRCRLH
jgi:hypothetical protein